MESQNNRRITISNIDDKYLKMWNDLKHLQLDGKINISEELEKKIIQYINDNNELLDDFLNTLHTELETLKNET